MSDIIPGCRERTNFIHCSNWETINAGVPQGTKLGPLLFLIMANDMRVSDDTVKFVDDTTIWEVVKKGFESESALPAQITECTNWVCENNMKLNPSKTKEIRVSNFALPPNLLPLMVMPLILSLAPNCLEPIEIIDIECVLGHESCLQFFSRLPLSKNRNIKKFHSHVFLSAFFFT